MKNPVYNIRFILGGLRYEYDVYAFDFGITYSDCLTMYFKEGSRIVVDEEEITDLEIYPLIPTY